MNVILEEKWQDNYYLKLESEFDSRMALADIKSVYIVEGFGMNTPVFIIRFMDAIGDLITHNRISPSAEYFLTFGKDELNSLRTTYSLSRNNFSNTSLGSSENVFSEVYFYDSSWFDLLGKRKFRSWGESRYSDVVEQIAQEVGFDDIEIEVTDGLYDVIQPGWNDFQLIKWMERRAISSETGVGGYEAGILSGNKFIFKTFNELSKDSPVREYVMAGADDNEDDFSKFFDFKIIQDYSEHVRQGASGYSYSYFDYMNGSYVKDKFLPSESNQRQLSDWIFVPEEHEGENSYVYGGSSEDTPNYVQNRVLLTGNSIQKIKITIKGDSEIRPGDVISILIAPSQYSKLPVNEFYSGYYLVSEVAHEVVFGRKEFFTELTLSRQGVNGPDVEGFIESQVGKVIGQS